MRASFASTLSRYEIRPARLPDCHPDIQDKAQQFLAAKKLEGLSQLTLDGYGIELRVFAEYVQLPTDQITTADIRQYLGSFEHLKLSSVSRKLSVLKSFFGWLTNDDLLTKDPTRKIKPPKKEKRLPKALSIEELEMIREACRTPRERALVEVFYATGGRLTEVQQMDRDLIDYQAMSVKVIGKGNKEREVFFSFKAIYHLKKYLMTRLDDQPALFVTERRPYRRLSNRAIQRAIDKIAERTGIQKSVHPHIFRHTFATLMLNNGADIAAVQELLGHEDPSTTQVYAQMSGERKKEQYKKHLVQ